MRNIIATANIIAITAIGSMPVLAQEIRDEGLRSVSSHSSDIHRYGVTREDHARAGLVMAHDHRRQTYTIIAFDLERNPEIREAFASAKNYTLSFELLGITNPDGSMLPLNVEFLGTFDDRNAAREFWTAEPLAVWKNVADSTTAPQVFELHTKDLADGKIDLSSASGRYAVFRFRMDDPSYFDNENRNYSLKTDARSYIFAVDSKVE